MTVYDRKCYLQCGPHWRSDGRKAIFSVCNHNGVGMACGRGICQLSSWLLPKRSYSVPRNIKFRSAPAAWTPGAPVLACRSVACTVAVWVVIHRVTSGRTPAAKWRSTCACRTAWSGRMAWWSEACTGYTSPPPPLRVQSRYNKVSPWRNRTGPPRAAPWWYRRRRQKTDAHRRYWSGPPTLCVGRPVTML